MLTTGPSQEVGAPVRHATRGTVGALPASSDGHPEWGQLTREWGDGFQSIHAVYWKARRETLQGTVEQIRTALAVLIGELVRSTPAGGETPTASAADQAVHTAISGGGSHTVNIFQASSGGTNTSGVAPSSDGGSWWSRWRNRCSSRPGTPEYACRRRSKAASTRSKRPGSSSDDRKICDQVHHRW
jgi:hypothetical protein